jgi:drug/metabolite transporter superfamily protein YnfA
VKKFNWGKFRSLFWFIAALLVVFVLWPLEDMLNDNIHTRRFCAYGQVYVEFQQGSKIWGTTFLDERGKPVSCTDDDVQHTISNKEII